jgi:hypothetical protein
MSDTFRSEQLAIPHTTRGISANLEALEDCAEQALGVALREMAEAQEVGVESRYPTEFVVGLQVVLAHTNAVRWTYEAAMREELLTSLQKIRERAEMIVNDARCIHSLGVAASNGLKRMHSEIQHTAEEFAREHELLLANRPPVKD